MLNHKDWSAWISVDGQELPQYKTTVEEEVSSIHRPPYTYTTYKISCWIPSEEGKEFSVHITTREQPISSSRAFVYMDGSSVAGRVFSSIYRSEVKISGRQSSSSKMEAPFLFSRLPMTDDDSALRDVSHLKDLGTIRISVDRIALLPGIIPAAASSLTEPESSGVSEAGPVHETSKKAGAHCVSYGKPKTVASEPVVNVQPLDGKPFVTFEFRYRSADLLRAQDVIPPVPRSKPQQDVTPRPPKRQRVESTAGPSVAQRKVKREEDREDVDDEIRALKAKLKSLEKRRNKENKGEIPKRPAKKAKTEPTDFSQFIDGEVIDLT